MPCRQVARAVLDRLKGTTMRGWPVPPPKPPTKTAGRIIAPVVEHSVQKLTVITKHAETTTREVLCDVLYVRLQGQYGS